MIRVEYSEDKKQFIITDLDHGYRYDNIPLKDNQTEYYEIATNNGGNRAYITFNVREFNEDGYCIVSDPIRYEYNYALLLQT